MTAPPADITEDRMTPGMALGLAGSGIVFLLAAAGLANGLASHLPIPDDLRQGAVAAHLASVMLALPLGISQLVLPKGTLRHRTVGYIWLALMTFTSLVSFAIHTINPGGLSPIHIFSVLTLVSVPTIVIQARRGQVAKHRRAVLGVIIGGLAIAGLFTFLPQRALGILVLRLFGQH
jgi:uncharacterized membrane protein